MLMIIIVITEVAEELANVLRGGGAGEKFHQTLESLFGAPSNDEEDDDVDGIHHADDLSIFFFIVSSGTNERRHCCCCFSL